MFWAQRSTARCADSTWCTQTRVYSARGRYIVRHWTSRGLRYVTTADGVQKHLPSVAWFAHPWDILYLVSLTVFGKARLQCRSTWCAPALSTTNRHGVRQAIYSISPNHKGGYGWREMNEWEYEMTWRWDEIGETGKPRENPKNSEIVHHNYRPGDIGSRTRDPSRDRRSI